MFFDETSYVKFIFVIEPKWLNPDRNLRPVRPLSARRRRLPAVALACTPAGNSYGTYYRINIPTGVRVNRIYDWVPGKEKKNAGVPVGGPL